MSIETKILDPLLVNADQVYLPNDSAELLTVVDPAKNLIECLTNIVTKYPPRDSYTELEAEGMYMGSPTGTAYAFMNVSTLHPDLLILSKTSRDWAGTYLSGSRPKPSTIDPEWCSLGSEELCFLAVPATYHRDIHYVHSLLSHIDIILSASAGCNGWHFGRAGQLYLLRLVRHWFPESKVSIDPYLSRIIDRILADGLPWPFLGFGIIGAARGRSGVCMQILLTDASYAPKLVPIVEQVLGWQIEDGNWQNTVPGMLISLETMRPYLDEFPDLQEKIAASVARGRKLVWKRGWLRKEPSICHGSTGNAFAFPGGNERDHFLAHATEGSVQNGLANGIFKTSNYGSQYSLGMGDVGRATGWLWHDRKDGATITYNDV